jgi:hypothetical protein
MRIVIVLPALPEVATESVAVEVICGNRRGLGQV